MQNTVGLRLTRSTLFIVSLTLGGCSPLVFANPIIGASSLAHSIVTGNTLGIITGTGGMAIENVTGSSVGEHVWNSVKHSTEPKPQLNTLE
mgnify:CR=1 FL=1|jgi:hypothetical protein